MNESSEPQSPSGVLLELSQILTDKARDIRRMADRDGQEGSSQTSGNIATLRS